MFDVFSNEMFIKKLVEENKSLGQKIKKLLTDFISELKNLIRNYKSSPEMNALKEQTEILEEINKSFATALDTASANMKNALSSKAETQNTALGESNIRLSRKKVADSKKKRYNKKVIIMNLQLI